MSDYKVNDSGERVEYPSGMVRDTQEGKTNYALIRDGVMFHRWAEHLTKGAEKYGKRNWCLANSPEEMERFVESACRHFEQWLLGEDDEDHAAAVMFNIDAAETVYEAMQANQAMMDAIEDMMDEELQVGDAVIVNESYNDSTLHGMTGVVERFPNENETYIRLKMDNPLPHEHQLSDPYQLLVREDEIDRYFTL